MDLYEDIQRIKSTINNTGIEAVDAIELVGILTEVQGLVKAVLNHEALSVSREFKGPWECHILTYLDDDAKKSLFDLLRD